MELEWIPSEMTLFDRPVFELEGNVLDNIGQFLIIIDFFLFAFLHSTIQNDNNNNNV